VSSVPCTLGRRTLRPHTDRFWPGGRALRGTRCPPIGVFAPARAPAGGHHCGQRNDRDGRGSGGAARAVPLPGDSWASSPSAARTAAAHCGLVIRSSRRTGSPSLLVSGIRQLGYPLLVPGWFCMRWSPTTSARDTPTRTAGVRGRQLWSAVATAAG